jgi:hypothetical protein
MARQRRRRVTTMRRPPPPTPAAPSGATASPAQLPTNELSPVSLPTGARRNPTPSLCRGRPRAARPRLETCATRDIGQRVAAGRTTAVALPLRGTTSTLPTRWRDHPNSRIPASRMDVVHCDTPPYAVQMCCRMADELSRGYTSLACGGRRGLLRLRFPWEVESSERCGVSSES